MVVRQKICFVRSMQERRPRRTGPGCADQYAKHLLLTNANSYHVLSLLLAPLARPLRQLLSQMRQTSYMVGDGPNDPPIDPAHRYILSPVPLGD